MESQVSPLIITNQPGIRMQPTWDDPFAFVVSLDPLTRHEFFYINGKIKDGWITDRDIEIIRFLAVHRWITLSQLTRLFFSGSDNTTVRNRLKKLMKLGLLRRIQWKTYCNPLQNRPTIYEMGSSAADILKFRFGAFLGNRDPRRPKEVSMLFRQKYIITNEFFILLRKSFNVMHFEFHPVLKHKEDQVVPTAHFILGTPKGKKLDFHLLCHREEENWLKTIRYQAKFCKEYFDANGIRSTLVVLVSSDEKAELASKICEQEGTSDYTWFITDQELEECVDVGLTNSFFVFKNGDKNYYDLR
ncbi:DNA-binding Lrp family transcriptional regulator [Paenibacillus sp. PastF-3]|uniref:replication-relaxation family protein n=1 Tax=unclassified Paenibacillus TaxID=185978 RepID=UPI0024734DC7|nr:replication-relaxation family protein [Paenibacillus sp. PastF-3]MDH6374266.1 DNA-binding Lrp family transcriptional regulator [Paenibacillus sp. PastF-3]